MSQSFLLGGVALFIPGRTLLVATEDNATQLSLSSTASQCLQLLIQHHGQVVEREYFFQQVWLNNGTQVTNNNFYQNISLLRRAFKEFGLNDELIITVPKVGIRLSSELVIERRVEPSAAADLPVKRAMAVIPEQKRRHRSAWPVFAGVGLAGLLGIFLLWRSEFDSRLQDFVPLAQRGECHIYGNEDAADYRSHQQFIQQDRLDCKRYPWAYVTQYPNFQRISVLRCRQQYSVWRDNQCITSYYLQEPSHAGA